MATGIVRLRRFVQEVTEIVRESPEEADLMAAVEPKLRSLVESDDWLPAAFTVPHPEHYQQYLLYCDPLERFSVVSFVWGPGQRTPVHDHTVWGLVGMLRGAEICRDYALDVGQRPQTRGETRLAPGQVSAVSPRIGDIHEVANAFADRTSISIHIYGANIGAVRRHVFNPVTGEIKEFVSGYANAVLPNLWDRSAEVRGCEHKPLISLTYTPCDEVGLGPH